VFAAALGSFPLLIKTAQAGFESVDRRLEQAAATLGHSELSIFWTISVPLAWYPRLLHATPKQRRQWEKAGAGYGIHWPDIDEDLSTDGLLRGAPAPKAA